MRLRTKLFIAWSSLMLLLWAATLWRVQHSIETNFDRVADDGFAGTRRSVYAVQAERLKQMRQACWLVTNIPELRALIAEVGSEISTNNLESLNERLDALSDMVGVDLFCVLDSRGALIAQNHRSPWPTLERLGEHLNRSPEAGALVRQVFTTSTLSKGSTERSVHGLWTDQGKLYQVVGVPLIFDDGSDNATPSADGALIMASTITDALTAELGQGHNCQITFLADGEAVASTLPRALRDELQASSDPRSWTAGPAFELSLGGTAYRSWLEPMDDPCSKVQVGSMLVQVSLADLHAAQSRMSRLMLGILGTGLLLGALASFILSAAVTRPVAELVAGVRKVADGDLDLALRSSRRDELGELAGAFNDMVSQLRSRHELQRLVEESQAASRAKSQFLANMSHEIRTPLNGVVGLTQLLLATPLNERQRRYTEQVQTSAGILTTLINDVLDFSKIEAGKMELECIPFSLHAVIEEVVDLLAPKAHRKRLELIADAGADLPAIVRGDPHRTRQILINLLNNAIKFTEKGEVILGARCTSASDGAVVVRFTVTDTGIGIPHERRDRLFRSFSQVDSSTTREHGGTGLGLAICKQLAELMDGSIGVESEPGRGSTFWFTATFAPEAQAPPSPGDATLHSLRAIIAESHAATGAILKQRFEEWGVHTSLVSNLDQLRSTLGESAAPPPRPPTQRIHLVLISERFTGTPGQLGDTLGAWADRDDVCFVLVAGADGHVDADTLRQRGFKAMLTKPVTSGRLKKLAIAAADPASRAEMGSDDPAPAVGEQSTRLKPARSARILLAEDNDVNQMVVVDMLANAGYQCDVVTDGCSAVDAAKGGRYDLILMDCQMPKMDGFQATRAIRECERSISGRRLPIIALTASAVRGDKQKCLDAGMDAYCTKPIEARELIQVIESFLPAAPRDSQMSITSPASNPEAGGANAPLDYDALLGRCSGKSELAGRVLQALAAKISDAVAHVQKCVTSGDAEDLARLAHGIKGAAGMASAHALQQAAARLEELSRAGDLDSAAAGLDAFRDEIRRCDRFIADALHKSTGTSRSAGKATE